MGVELFVLGASVADGSFGGAWMSFFGASLGTKMKYLGGSLLFKFGAMYVGQEVGMTFENSIAFGNVCRYLGVLGLVAHDAINFLPEKVENFGYRRR
ncbi:MAG: hypothetical protein ABIH92_03405 [Nanoarchaeota archaeon]